MKALITTLLVFVSLALTLPVSAQGEEPMPAQVAKFFTEIANLSIKNVNNCPQMGVTLNKYLDDNQEVLNNAAYSVEEANDQQEQAILLASKSLGESTGKCFNDSGVNEFMTRFVKITVPEGGVQ